MTEDRDSQRYGGAMDPEDSRSLSDREHTFALQQYAQIGHRVTELQKEREVWIRHSIIATFAFIGWILANRESVSDTLMLDVSTVAWIAVIPFVFNLGGALRFFFIQRDINALVDYMVLIEREVLCLSGWLCDLPSGRGIRDRHWHAPSICYWVFTCIVTAMVFVLSVA